MTGAEARMSGRPLSLPWMALVLACAFVCISAPSAVAASAVVPRPQLFGVTVQGLPGDAQAARALHANAIRIGVIWSELEPTGPGVRSAPAVASLDRTVAAAAAAHLRVVMVVDSSPCWASSAPAALARRCRPGRGSAANAWPPTQPSAYAAFVAYLAARYESDLAAIEIWNEPDQANQDYFAGPHKAQRYAAILRAAYPAIKHAAPGVRVLAGAIVGDNGKFLRALYASGIKGYYDGLAVHFYTLTVAAVRYTHEVQLRYGDQTPLWLDEFGFSSCWPRRRTEQEQACVTSALQGTNLAGVVRQLARLPYMAAMIVYKLQSSPGEDFGLLGVGGARKHSFAALAGAFANPFGSIGTTSVGLRGSGGAVVASGSAPPGDFMLLEALQGAVVRYRVVFTLDRFNRYTIRLPAALGVAGLSVRVYQYQQPAALGAQASI